MGNVFIGTSGYSYKDWKGVFYPEDLPQKEWLTFYSQHFTTIEINATFYRSFPKTVFENWKKEVGEEFLFSIKGSRFITHSKRINHVEKEIKRFFEKASGLEQKLGCILWQFPKNFLFTQEHIKRLQTFLSLLPSSIKQFVEFRDQSWNISEVFTLLTTYNTGWVINDSSKFPKMDNVTGQHVYIRFHGPSNLYASSYTDKQLSVWAEKIKEYRKKYDVFCYFNNDVSGFAIKNAKRLRELLE